MAERVEYVFKPFQRRLDGFLQNEGFPRPPAQVFLELTPFFP